ncbi:MAG: hypothetical protein PUI56_05115 [bacterium]|nr:hypothetical protein [bacterium]MDY2572261.1 hypothetical protein [Candidatus Enterosoma sp.]MDY5256719.1 hypothetical protein [Candidatus Enterosoma sp.]
MSSTIDTSFYILLSFVPLMFFFTRIAKFCFIISGHISLSMPIGLSAYIIFACCGVTFGTPAKIRHNE